MLEPMIIVPESAVALGQKYARTRFYGWLVAGLLALVAVFFAGQASVYKKTKNDLEISKAEIDYLRQEQVRTNEALASSWRNQQEGIKLIITWGEYIKSRESIKLFNIKSGPCDPALPINSKNCYKGF